MKVQHRRSPSSSPGLDSVPESAPESDTHPATSFVLWRFNQLFEGHPVVKRQTDILVMSPGQSEVDLLAELLSSSSLKSSPEVKNPSTDQPVAILYLSSTIVDLKPEGIDGQEEITWLGEHETVTIYHIAISSTFTDFESAVLVTSQRPTLASTMYSTLPRRLYGLPGRLNFGMEKFGRSLNQHKGALLMDWIQSVNQDPQMVEIETQMLHVSNTIVTAGKGCSSFDGGGGDGFYDRADQDIARSENAYLRSYMNMFKSLFNAVRFGKRTVGMCYNTAVSQFEFLQTLLRKHRNRIRARGLGLVLTNEGAETWQTTMVSIKENLQQYQQQSLKRLAKIQARIQKVVSDSRIISDAPVPRFFVVLLEEPLPTGTSLGSWVQSHFRLHFLCECHEPVHPGSLGGGRSKSRHPEQHRHYHAHFTSHPGYVLKDPQEFFIRYGSLALAWLQTLKYGAQCEEMNIPPLESMEILDFGLAAHKGKDRAEIRRLAARVESMIGFLGEWIETRTRVDRTIALLDHAGTGSNTAMRIDFSWPELFLIDHRQGSKALDLRRKRDLGNLFRVVRPSPLKSTGGSVRWICADHYDTPGRNTQAQDLRSILETNNIQGEFQENRGTLFVILDSAQKARLIYSALGLVSCVLELSLVLCWTMTAEERKELFEALGRVNLVSIEIQWTNPSNRPQQLVPSAIAENDDHFPELLVQMRQLQSFSLRGCYRVLRQLSGYVWHETTASSIEFLRLDTDLDGMGCRSEEGHHLRRLLAMCPQLQVLILEVSDLDSVYTLLQGSFVALKNLKSVALIVGAPDEEGKAKSTIRATITLRDGEPKSAEATVTLPLMVRSGAFWYSGLLEKLTVSPLSNAANKSSFRETQLIQLVYFNPSLDEIAIRRKVSVGQYPRILEWLIMELRGLEGKRTLRVMFYNKFGNVQTEFELLWRQVGEGGRGGAVVCEIRLEYWKESLRERKEDLVAALEASGMVVSLREENTGMG